MKRLEKRGAALWLVSDNPNHQPIDLSLQGQDFELWGVVTHIITETAKRSHHMQ